jgi:23S rRNA (uracil1939-C5)-methyltransferase
VSGVCWFAKSVPSAAPAGDLVTRTQCELLLLARGNLRKQGTVTRLANAERSAGAHYKKQADVGRHSLLLALAHDRDERSVLTDFASISHPVLGDAAHGDAGSNQFMEHRHGLDRAFVHVARSRLLLADGSHVEASSELSPELQRVLKSLGSD